MPDQPARRLPFTGTSARLRSLNAPVGMVLLVVLLFGAVSGLAIWLQLTAGAGIAMWLIAVHAYVGLLGLPVLVAKTVVGAVSWRHRATRPRTPPLGAVDHLMTALLVLAVLTLYTSGVLMYANWSVLAGSTLKLVHLWSALAGAPVLSYHLWRFLGRARAAVGYAVRSVPEPEGAGRRGVLLAAGLALLGWGAVRVGAGSVAALDRQGPNDFPVTLTSGGADQPDPNTWRMRVDGQVRQPLSLSLADLRARSTERHRYSLDCVLGWSATRTWGGVPLRDLLDSAGASSDLLSVVVRSTTGYQVTLLREQVEDPRTLVTWEVDGVDLTPEHGYPARIMAQGVIGERCLKWVDSVTVISA
ncbi:molybdopterin-dependent oxidoreductase [Ornithinimicrobium sp. W1679]|uniref:molybdopterin-dependent oxidoreductase n=1 Tax=Ornithinimicrobium sp. W1679 TaxID=3418770 RepID=UPI003CE9AB36